MNLDVGHTVLLLAAIIAPSGSVLVWALRRYQAAHCDLAAWRRQGPSQPAE